MSTLAFIGIIFEKRIDRNASFSPGEYTFFYLFLFICFLIKVIGLACDVRWNSSKLGPISRKKTEESITERNRINEKNDFIYEILWNATLQNIVPLVMKAAKDSNRISHWFDRRGKKLESCDPICFIIKIAAGVYLWNNFYLDIEKTIRSKIHYHKKVRKQYLIDWYDFYGLLTVCRIFKARKIYLDYKNYCCRLSWFRDTSLTN